MGPQERVRLEVTRFLVNAFADAIDDCLDVLDVGWADRLEHAQNIVVEVLGDAGCSGCSAVPIHAKGMCKRCYMIARRSGAQLPDKATTLRPRPSAKSKRQYREIPEKVLVDFLDTYESRTATEPQTGCWEWTGAINTHGYGTFRSFPAHRVSKAALGGGVERDQVVDHVCENKACVNPDHLQCVSALDNLALWGIRRAAQLNKDADT